jgi:hypothetical protein
MPLQLHAEIDTRARETNLKRLAEKRGLLLRPAASNSREAGRFHIVDPTVNGVMGSRHKSFPHSFSLKEAEEWFATRRRRPARREH